MPQVTGTQDSDLKLKLSPDLQKNLSETSELIAREPRITCHSCRHSAATNMLIFGVDIAKVQQTLRHRNPATTQIYRHDLDEFNNDATNIVADMLFG